MAERRATYLIRDPYVYGISGEAGPVATRSGVEEVEALPHFARWAVKPRIGEVLQTTKELRGTPYIVEVRGPADRFEALDLIGRARWSRGTPTRVGCVPTSGTCCTAPTEDALGPPEGVDCCRRPPAAAARPIHAEFPKRLNST